MVVVLSIAIGSEAIFLIIILMSRHSVMSRNALNMFLVEARSFFVRRGRGWG